MMCWASKCPYSMWEIVMASRPSYNSNPHQRLTLEIDDSGVTLRPCHNHMEWIWRGTDCCDGGLPDDIQTSLGTISTVQVGNSVYEIYLRSFAQTVLLTIIDGERDKVLDYLKTSVVEFNAAGHWPIPIRDFAGEFHILKGP